MQRERAAGSLAKRGGTTTAQLAMHCGTSGFTNLGCMTCTVFLILSPPLISSKLPDRLASAKLATPWGLEMITNILIALICCLIGLLALWQAEQLAIPDFLQSVGSELYGAAVITLGGWALFGPTRNLKIARRLRDNHVDLFQRVLSPKALSVKTIQDFIEQAERLVKPFRFGPKKHKAFDYINALKAFKTENEQQDFQYNAKNFRAAWNAVVPKFIDLLECVHTKIGRTARKEENLFYLQAGQRDVPPLTEAAAESANPPTESERPASEGRSRK